MGSRLKMLTIFDKVPEEVWDELGLIPTDVSYDMAEREVCGIRVRDNVYGLCLFDSSGLEIDFRRLSKKIRLLMYELNETAMCSISAEWKNGVEVWSLIHCSEPNVEQLDSSGDVPEVVHELYEKALREQREQTGPPEWRVDCILDVPLQVYAAAGGIREDVEEGTFVWQQLELAGSSKQFSVSDGRTNVAASLRRPSPWWWPFG